MSSKMRELPNVDCRLAWVAERRWGRLKDLLVDGAADYLSSSVPPRRAKAASTCA